MHSAVPLSVADLLALLEQQRTTRHREDRQQAVRRLRLVLSVLTPVAESRDKAASENLQGSPPATTGCIRLGRLGAGVRAKIRIASGFRAKTPARWAGGYLRASSVPGPRRAIHYQGRTESGSSEP